jgi:transposase
MTALYRVHLTTDERRALSALTRRGQTPVREVTRARVLLLADRAVPDDEIADIVELHPRTVQRLRRRWAEGGLEAALHDRPRPGAQRVLDGKQEAHLIALACTDPPAGHRVWTMQLLADRLVELTVVDAISDETVRRTLKKTISSPGRPSSGAFRP